MTDAELVEILGEIPDPELGQTLEQLGMLESATIDGDGRVRVVVQLPTPAYPDRQRIAEAVRAVVGDRVGEAGEVEVEFTHVVRGVGSGGKIGLRVANVIAVGSGKGGVGKSTVSAGLAFALKASGARVGLMDADVYGPSIPHLLGARGEPTILERTGDDGQKVQRIQPVDVDGLKLMSMGFHIDTDQAVIWRGPLLHRTLTQFLQSTDWGELDYLVIDLPPGTGDVALTISQLLSLAGAVIVCTPQQVALLDARKAISMFREVKIPVLGIVENMSGEMFGRGGARQLAEKLELPFLGELAAEPEVRILGDAGRAADLVADECPVAAELVAISERVAIEIARQVIDSPGLPELEIL